MVQQDQEWLDRVARLQRQYAGRPREGDSMGKEHALGLCGCGWTNRPPPVALSSNESPLLVQQQVYDSATIHHASHGADETVGMIALDCDEVRPEIGAPDPDFYPRPYLQCQTRFYLLGDVRLQDAYNLHWDRCTIPEAVRRVAAERRKEAQKTVLTRGDTLLPGWEHVR